jgi:hypothetical protein
MQENTMRRIGRASAPFAVALLFVLGELRRIGGELDTTVPSFLFPTKEEQVAPDSA